MESMNNRIRNWWIGGIIGFIALSVIFEGVSGIGAGYVIAVVIAYYVLKPSDEDATGSAA
jgi:hypothetical protein